MPVKTNNRFIATCKWKIWTQVVKNGSPVKETRYSVPKDEGKRRKLNAGQTDTSGN